MDSCKMLYNRLVSETLLRPYTDFDSRELAGQLHEAVSAEGVRSQLEARNIRGPIQRYGGSLDEAAEKIQKGQHEHTTGELAHYAIVGSSGDVIGAGSLMPDLPLHKLRAPVPSSVGRRTAPLLARAYNYATPNVAAWTSGGEDVLAQAYRELVNLSDTTHTPGEPTSEPPLKSVWTLEPARSPTEIHEAIVAYSGMMKIANRRFDDGEQTRWEVSPRSVLYARLNSNWFSTHGRLKELKTGQHSRLARLDRLLSEDQYDTIERAYKKTSE